MSRALIRMSRRARRGIHQTHPALGHTAAPETHLAPHLRTRHVLHRAQALVPRARRGVTVLAYHLIDGGSDSPVDIGLDAFRAHLDHLAAHARVVPLCDADPGGPPDQVVITFDDAYANFHEVAWPLLRERGLPATLYVPVDYLDGGDTPIRGRSIQACTWDQLREMASQGLDIGSHTCSHPDLRALDGPALEREIAGSRAVLEERLGVPVRTFCYPRGLHTRAARRAVGAAYELGVVGGGRKYRPGTPRHSVPRISLRRDHPVATFPAMLRQRVWVEELVADTARQWLP